MTNVRTHPGAHGYPVQSSATLGCTYGPLSPDLGNNMIQESLEKKTALGSNIFFPEILKDQGKAIEKLFKTLYFVHFRTKSQMSIDAISSGHSK